MNFVKSKGYSVFENALILQEHRFVLIFFSHMINSVIRYANKVIRSYLPSCRSIFGNAHCSLGKFIVADPCVQDVTKFRNLPWARLEVQMIGRIRDCTPLTGRQATKNEVLRRLGSVGVVHIAAHGSMETGEIALAPENG